MSALGLQNEISNLDKRVKFLESVSSSHGKDIMNLSSKIESKHYNPQQQQVQPDPKGDEETELDLLYNIYKVLLEMKHIMISKKVKFKEKEDDNEETEEQDDDDDEEPKKKKKQAIKGNRKKKH